jgi:predicted DNA-binding transcriptional regulator YafY
MKSDRLLSALILLQAHERLSTREIAERLEVSQRTAHRDMEALCAAGIPLNALRGVHGGWELEKGWRTKVPGLDKAELQGLLMAQPNALGDRKLAAAAQRAFDKLMASMPVSMRVQAESIRARLYIDSTGWRPTKEDTSMLAVVQDALAENRKLTFLYTRADGDTASRTVDPLGIVCKQAAWYLVARAASGMRTYRVSRMRDAVALAITFERPENFDLAAYWKQSVAALSGQKEYVSATLALSPQGVTVLDRWCPMLAIPEHSASQWLPAGWLVFEVQFENYNQARFVAMGLGSSAIALAPDELCSAIAAEMKQMRIVARSRLVRGSPSNEGFRGATGRHQKTIP